MHCFSMQFFIECICSIVNAFYKDDEWGMKIKLKIKLPVVLLQKLLC